MGSEIDDELINYGEQDIADELDIVYRRVEKQGETLHVGTSITKKLTLLYYKEKAWMFLRIYYPKS